MSDYICFEIQQEIIKRLPVKSLIQFRSVCKAWKSLIDSSKFIAGYSAPHTRPQHLLVKYEVGYLQETEVKYICFVDDDTFPQQRFTPTIPPLLKQLNLTRLIGSVDGVLCFLGHYRRTQGNSRPNSITHMVLLWNPSIRKSTAVVVPNVLNAPFSRVISFGLRPATSDPLLIKITYIGVWVNPKSISCIPFHVMVFTLSSREWRCLSSNLPRKSIAFTWSSAVVGQFIYWFAFDRFDENGRLGFRNLIMSFDMCTEEFTEIDLPYSLSHLGKFIYHPELAYSVSRLGESLVVLDFITYTNSLQASGVWMMEDGDPKSFTKLFTVKAPDAMIKRTLGFTKSGKAVIEKQDEDDLVGLFYIQPTLGVYEPCSEDIKDLGILANGNSVFMRSYTESLLLLNEEDGCVL